MYDNISLALGPIKHSAIRHCGDVADGFALSAYEQIIRRFQQYTSANDVKFNRRDCVATREQMPTSFRSFNSRWLISPRSNSHAHGTQRFTLVRVSYRCNKGRCRSLSRYA
ncbi:hypothetical protein KCP77_22720 [Salmonella enterica subsp. enterica]|nr:hypothetical protein KCP77_22720 [Salmonella enterica subsp. enterica]